MIPDNATPTPEIIVIFIKEINGRTIPLQISPSVPLKHYYRLPENAFLLHNGRYVSPNLNVQQLGFDNNATIHLPCALRGGMKRPLQAGAVPVVP